MINITLAEADLIITKSTSLLLDAVDTLSAALTTLLEVDVWVRQDHWGFITECCFYCGEDKPEHEDDCRYEYARLALLCYQEESGS